MTDTALIVSVADELEAIIRLVLDGLGSENSRRSYRRSLTDFLNWYDQRGRPGLSKALVQEYRSMLQARGLANASINLRLAAIRKLVQEGADNGMIDQGAVNGVLRIKGLPQHGHRSGNWLSRDQAQELLSAPDITTLKGLRDRAILAVLLGAGLRRSEVTGLRFEHLRFIEGRWVIVDLIGKGNRIRSVPIPAFTKRAIDAWAAAAHISSGYVFRSLDRKVQARGGSDERISEMAVYLVVNHYAQAIGVPDLATHDTRRTYARLALKGGSPIPQISLSLGHASIVTTERYLGLSQDWQDAPCDHLGLR